MNTKSALLLSCGLLIAGLYAPMAAAELDRGDRIEQRAFRIAQFTTRDAEETLENRIRDWRWCNILRRRIGFGCDEDAFARLPDQTARDTADTVAQDDAMQRLHAVPAAPDATEVASGVDADESTVQKAAAADAAAAALPTAPADDGSGWFSAGGRVRSRLSLSGARPAAAPCMAALQRK